MTILKKSLFQMFLTILLRFDQQRLSRLIYFLIKGKSLALPPADSLKFLFLLENKIYRLTIKEAIRYGNGIHPKHRHLKYHDFFVNHIEPGSRILDIGCGNGAVAFDIAVKVPDVIIYGVDMDVASIEQAQKRFSHDHIRFVHGDVLHDLPEQQFEVIILSNVLEHLEHRVHFLRELQHRYHPRKFLIRVPMFERHWQVPLQEELGIDYHLDKDHYIEYRQEEFLQEMKEAGLQIIHSQFNWGEIWAEVVSDNN